MSVEIERKFLVADDRFRTLAQGVRYRQGYLNSAKERVVRVRTIDDQGVLTIKGITTGATRVEYEYAIPLADARAMLDDLCEQPLVEKNRYKIAHQGFTWEVDEFFGANQGLVVAEIELAREDQPFAKPVWIGQEVTGDPRYFNSNLIQHPFQNW